MMSHEDMPQDAAMIKSVLQKICDEMDALEADRITPDHRKPGYSEGSAGIPRPNENSAETPRQAEPENHTDQENQHEPLDPHVLSELMDKALSADDQGSTPEDEENMFPQEIQDAINRKRGRH